MQAVPVLVLHDVGGSLERMGCQIQALAPALFVIAADRRGNEYSTGRPLAGSQVRTAAAAGLSL
jgi:hypothetical protein